MKTILIDAIHAFIIKNEGIFQEMYILLEQYPNKKIILTGATVEQMEKFGLNDMPYEVFSLHNNPKKTDPKYFDIMLKQFHLNAKDAIYFEHNLNAIKSAETHGISTFYYDSEKKDLITLKKFIDENL
jgi:FMN phosphatase YigB (HAD superfamily)